MIVVHGYIDSTNMSASMHFFLVLFGLSSLVKRAPVARFIKLLTKFVSLRTKDQILHPGVCMPLVSATTCYWHDTYNIRHTLYCPYSDCCGNIYNRYCCDYTPVGRIVGAVVGGVIFIGIIVGIIACCTCACCPYHRYRSRGTVIATTTQPNYGTTVTVPATGRTVQPYTAMPTSHSAPYQSAPPPYK